MAARTDQRGTSCRGGSAVRGRPWSVVKSAGRATTAVGVRWGQSASARPMARATHKAIACHARPGATSGGQEGASGTVTGGLVGASNPGATIQPRRIASMVASVRDCTSIFSKMLRRCTLTVLGLITSSRAISSLLSPRANNSRISISRRVRVLSSAIAAIIHANPTKARNTDAIEIRSFVQFSSCRSLQ